MIHPRSKPWIALKLTVSSSDSRLLGRVFVWCGEKIVPFAQSGQYRSESLSTRGKFVFDSWRNCRILGAIDNPIFLQLTELKRQGATANSREQSMQLVEAFGTGYQMPDDSHFPFPGYRLQAAQRSGNFEARTSHYQFYPKQECLDLVLLSFDQKERSQRFLRGTLRGRSA